MTHYTQTLVPYNPSNGPTAASNATAQGGSVGNININTAPQAVQVYAADETPSKSFNNYSSGILKTVASIGLVALAADYAVNKDDSVIAKGLAPDVNNTTLNVPATRINNYIRPQTDGSAMRKMQEAIDSLKANGQEVLLLPPVDTTLAPPPKASTDSIPSAPAPGL